MGCKSYTVFAYDIYYDICVSKCVLVYPTGEFKECTILFSDVVSFTNMCSLCEPIQIVLMLNAMYLRFDRLTTVHNVYKVHRRQRNNHL